MNKAEYDLIIRAGTIVDGTKVPRYVGGIAIVGDRIAKIGGLRRSTATKVLDASGLIVAPGFVDLHTHYDAQIQWDPYCTVSGWHGITSVVIGNCGFGFAPCAPNQKDRDRAMLALTRNEAIPYEPMKLGMLWDWVSFPEFLDSIDRIPNRVNLISYVPLTPIYAWVMGYDEAKSRRPTEAELKEMCRLLHESMDVGGCGWSAQVLGPRSIQRDYDGTPMITDLMTDEEFLTFARVSAERDEGSIELAYRDTGEEGRMLDEASMVFFEKVAEVAKRPVLHQAVVTNDNNPTQHRQRLRWLEECARRQVRLNGQGATRRSAFELTFEDWNLFDERPHLDPSDLGDARGAQGQDAGSGAAGRPEGGVGQGILPETIIQGSIAGLIVEDVGRRDLEHYVGQSVGEIAEKEGKHVIDALLDIVVADNLQTQFEGSVGRSNPEYTAEIMRSPYVLSGVSDGGAHVKFLPGGVYPTEMLTWLVRDEGLLSLEEAHFKLSYLNAVAGGFRDGGFLREGAPADIVVYDLDKLALGPNEVVHDLPGGDWRRVQKAEGHRWTLVNGQVTLEDGAPTGALSGKLLRHGAA